MTISLLRPTPRRQRAHETLDRPARGDRRGPRRVAPRPSPAGRAFPRPDRRHVGRAAPAGQAGPDRPPRARRRGAGFPGPSRHATGRAARTVRRGGAARPAGARDRVRGMGVRRGPGRRARDRSRPRSASNGARGDVVRVPVRHLDGLGPRERGPRAPRVGRRPLRIHAPQGIRPSGRARAALRGRRTRGPRGGRRREGAPRRTGLRHVRDRARRTDGRPRRHDDARARRRRLPLRRRPGARAFRPHRRPRAARRARGTHAHVRRVHGGHRACSERARLPAPGGSVRRDCGPRSARTARFASTRSRS